MKRTAIIRSTKCLETHKRYEYVVLALNRIECLYVLHMWRGPFSIRNPLLFSNSLACCNYMNETIGLSPDKSLRSVGKHFSNEVRFIRIYQIAETKSTLSVKTDPSELQTEPKKNTWLLSSCKTNSLYQLTHLLSHWSIGSDNFAMLWKKKSSL